MSNSATITREQLRTVLIATELGGRTGDSDHFSYAQLGSSSSSFGQMQFDVDANCAARTFLTDNGFDAADIVMLRLHGQLSDKDQAALDAKLQAIPQDKLDQFTNQQLDSTISRVSGIIDRVLEQNPAAAEAIINDPKLQLGIADYANQFSSRHDAQLVGFLAGKTEHGVQVSNPPTRDDMQNFIGSTVYGQNPHNTRGVASREARFNHAMGQLGLGPAAPAHGHTADMTGSALHQGAQGPAVTALQADLAALGYTDNRSQVLQPDGHYGHTTEAAVRAFQDDHGLPSDGGAGKHTLEATQGQRQLLNGIPALVPELDGFSPPRVDGYDPANRAPAERDPRAPALPEAPASANPLADPRHPDSPQHAMYCTLKDQLPRGTSEERLAQATAACYLQGIDSPGKLASISGANGQLVFGSNSFLAPPATVDMTQPAPSVQQSTQQIRQYDQQQAQINAQQPPGPVIG